MNKIKEYPHIIFNWDCHDIFGVRQFATTRNDFRKRVLEPLVKMGAGAIFYSMLTSDVVVHNSNVAELYGQHTEKFNDVGQWKIHCDLMEMIKNGKDELTRLIEMGHKAGLDIFPSMRMNDWHATDPSNGLHAVLYSKFKKDHPELLIKRDEKDWGSWLKTFDFAHEEVRKLRLALAKETCENYEIDGLELDFMRGPFFFSQGQEITNRGFMTNLVHRIRKVLDTTSKKRNCPLRLAVRVPATFDCALRAGLDVKEWLKNGWIDILVVGSGYVPMNAPIGEYVEATRGTKCRVYGCNDRLQMPDRADLSRTYNSPGTNWTEEQVRAWASDVLFTGADGFYLFNWQYEEAPAMLRSALDESKIQHGNKDYVLDNGAFRMGMSEWVLPAGSPLPIMLVESSSGIGHLIDFRIGDDITSSIADGTFAGAKLKVRFENLSVLDHVKFKLNGADIGRTEGSEADQVFPIASPPLRHGQNTLEVILEKRNSAISPPLIVRNGNVLIEYKR